MNRPKFLRTNSSGIAYAIDFLIICVILYFLINSFIS